jgi:beta-lactamase class D
MKIHFLLPLLAAFVLTAFAPRPRTVVRDDFKKHFEAYQLQGSFLLYDLQQNRYTSYNPARCAQGFIPASTFKILNTLIGLETGVIPDQDFVIRWDRVQRPVAAWNQDHTLTSAFRVSCVPYYQELARRVGLDKMQQYTSRSGFGKLHVTPETLDNFWLEGPSRVSQEEQIDFLVRLYQNKLPFSERSTRILKDIMLLVEGPTHQLRGKTGWGQMEGKDIGWFVGYLVRDGKAYFFATNVEATNPDNELFSASRRGITETLLRELKLL